MGANDQAFIDAFAETFYNRRDEIAARLPQTTDITGNKRDMLEATYEIQPIAHENFFKAYTAALTQAFIDHNIQNNDIITIIDDAYRDAITDAYGVTLDPLAPSKET